MAKIDNKRQSIGEGFVILAFANILVKILSLVFVPLIRSLLGGDAGYSVYSSAYSVYAFVYVIATAGFPVAISKLISELSRVNRTKEAARAFRLTRRLLIIVGGILMALIMIFSKPIARFMNNEDSWLGILALAPTIFVCSILSGYRGYFQGRKNMRPTAISQVIEQLIHVAVSVVLVVALKDKGIVMAVAGASIGTGIGALAALGFCLYDYKKDSHYFATCIENEAPIRKEQGLKNLTDNALWKRIFFYSLPILVSSAVQYGGDLIDSRTIKGGLVTAGFLEDAAKTLHGQYMAMRQLINVPGALATALCIAVLPAITSSLAAGKIEKVSRNTQFSFKLCYLIAVPASFAYAIFSVPIYRLLGYGNNYILLTLSSLSVILLCSIHLQGSIMQAHNMMFASSITMIICVVLKALLNYLLVRIPGLNIYGAIIATYVSYLIPFTLNNYLLKKRTNLKYSVATAMGPCASSAAISMTLGFVVYLLIKLVLSIVTTGYISYILAFLPAFGVAAVLYYYILRKSGGLTDFEIKKISPKFTKYAKMADRVLKI